MDHDPTCPFYILLSNFYNRPTNIPKHQRIAIATPLHSTPIHLWSDIVAVPIAEETRTEHVIPPLAEGDTADRRQATHIGETFAADRNSIYTLLEQLYTFWDGNVGEIDVREHRTGLTFHAKQVHKRPYRDGTETCAVIRREIAKMPKAGVVEPANTEWDSPVLFYMKMDG